MPYTSKTTVYGAVDTTAVMNPMKMFEYMAAGRATVATRLPAILEVLHDDLAVLVDPDRPDSVPAALQRLLDDDGLRERLASNAREAAVSRHSWGAHAKTILEDVT